MKRGVRRSDQENCAQKNGEIVKTVMQLLTQLVGWKFKWENGK